MKTLKSINVTLVLALALIVLLGYNFMSAQVWTAPTAVAPGGNVSAPVNISSGYQIKSGDLGVVRVRAGDYCNAAGTVCITPGNWTCPAGKALSGINANGTVNCAD